VKEDIRHLNFTIILLLIFVTVEFLREYAADLIKSRKLMFKSNELKESNEIVSIHSSDIPEQKIPKIIEELVDLVGKYKAKRNLWEVKLKTRSYNDPTKPDLYAIIARLATLDMMVIDLERLMDLLTNMTKFIHKT
jgi:hypothetical protein